MEIARTMRKPAVPKRHTPQIQDMNNDRRQVKQIQNNIVSIVEQISKVAIQSKAITVQSNPVHIRQHIKHRPHIAAAQDSNPIPARQASVKIGHAQQIIAAMHPNGGHGIEQHIAVIPEAAVMIQDKQLQVIHPARRITPKHRPHIAAARASNPIPAR